MQRVVRASRRANLAARLAELRHPHTIADEMRRRSVDRYRRVAFTAITSLAAKSVTLLTAVTLVPIAFRYLGPERYGLWMTITSFVLFLGFADMGIGNGLSSRIAEAHGSNNAERMPTLVSAAFYSLLVLSVFLLAVFTWVSPRVDMPGLYNVHSAVASSEAGTATLCLLACTFISMPLSVVLRVEIGLQQGFIADLWNGLGSLLGLIAVILVIRNGGGLPAMVLAMSGVPQLITACNWISQFCFVKRALRPRLRLFRHRVAVDLLGMGGLFFLQQCFGLIYYVSDNLVIARTMGSASVGNYAVLQRLFSIGLVTQYFVIPLWPAVGEALARRDFAWALRTARRAVYVTLGLGTFCSLTLLLSSRYVVTRWSGIDPGPIDLLRVGFAIWVILVGYIATMNALLNQPALMRRHLVIFGTASLASLVLKIGFARHGSLAGVIWATNIAFGLIYCLPALFLAFRYGPQGA